jgi:hypothetical protein
MLNDRLDGLRRFKVDALYRYSLKGQTVSFVTGVAFLFSASDCFADAEMTLSYNTITRVANSASSAIVSKFSDVYRLAGHSLTITQGGMTKTINLGATGITVVGSSGLNNKIASYRVSNNTIVITVSAPSYIYRTTMSTRGNGCVANKTVSLRPGFKLYMNDTVAGGNDIVSFDTWRFYNVRCSIKTVH